VIGTGGANWDRRNAALADGVALARDLISEPANVIYPESFVDRTRKALAGTRGVTIDVLDETQMERMGMGAILSVGKGSARPPRMLVIHYRGSNAQPVVLAGKGITFDTGGISIKPGAGLWRMKGDMAGAAAVVGTIHALAKSGAPVNVVAIAALAENMPGDAATRPGDIVRAMNGKTIEVLNTDAEGRMVLADAVAYGERQFKPAAIVDIATLTGAKVTALGSDHAALFARNDGLAAQLEAASETTGEKVWRLPLTDAYSTSIKSQFADYANVSDGGGGAPGAAYGAAFIGAFVTPATPFAHLDIAGMQFGITGALTPTGVDAFGVRLLESFVRNFQPVAGE
jgi:leucyl aminopeptidase